jgi:hypothetical protein
MLFVVLGEVQKEVMPRTLVADALAHSFVLWKGSCLEVCLTIHKAK